MRRPPFPVLRDRSRQRGISLVETMIGMALGLVATFVIIQSFSSSETYRRNLAGTVDAHGHGEVHAAKQAVGHAALRHRPGLARELSVDDPHIERLEQGVNDADEDTGL